MKKNILIIFISFLIASCESSVDVPKDKLYFPSDTVLIENNYPIINNETVIRVIQNLKICSNSDTNMRLVACDNENFRVFPLGPEIKYEKAFIIEMKEGVYDSPVKQVMVIQKTFNKYKIVNRYLGFLMEYRTSKTGYNDLLIGYKDPEIGLVVIKHNWVKDAYQPVDVEEINGYFIKPELKDSINDLFISSFNAGY